MALKAIVDKIDDAPEALREHYVAGTAENGAEGKFILAVESVGGWALEDVSGLKSALGKERTTREKLERDVVAFKDLDPAKAKAALSELEELKKLDPTAEADKIANTKFEAAKAQLLEKHGADIAAKEERIGKLSGAVDRLVRQAAATAAIAEARGSVDLLLPHVLAHTKVKETDAGDFIVEVVDRDGNARIGDSKGSLMDIKGLVAEMRQSDTFARAFDGDGHSGGGKQPDALSGPKKGDMGGSREERRAAIASKFKIPAE